MKYILMIVRACVCAAILFPGSVRAVDLRFPIEGQPTYPTFYVNHGGSDWSCGNFTYAGHPGTDFGIGGFPEMDKGRDLVAAADGTVTGLQDGEFDRCTSGCCSPTNGNYVTIQHDDETTLDYIHLRKFSACVSVGQRVACGQKIGEVGSSGYSTGPHIHLQYSVGDPFAGPCSGSTSSWVAQGQYRDLPARVCDPKIGCGGIATSGAGSQDHGVATAAVVLVSAFFIIFLKNRIGGKP